MKMVSILIPLFDEVENVENAYSAVTDVMRPLSYRYDWEILFTDNHSTDGTWELLQRIAQKDPRVRAVRYSKNFGFQQSLYGAYTLAAGDAAIQIDCDLQDPPGLIPHFLESWEQGYHVVYGIRSTREEGRLLAASRKLFYRLMRALGDPGLPVDAGDFRLVDRIIIDEITKFHDYSPYLRSTIAWMGFHQKGIPYHRAGRKAGRSKFAFRDLLAFAVDGIVAHSILPLRVAAVTGFGIGILSVVGALGYIVGKIFFHQDWPIGLATIGFLLLILISIHAIFLGTIGEYVGRIYLQSKGRPIVIIESSLNLDRAPRSIRGGVPAP